MDQPIDHKEDVDQDQWGYCKAKQGQCWKLLRWDKGQYEGDCQQYSGSNIDPIHYFIDKPQTILLINHPYLL